MNLSHDALRDLTTLAQLNSEGRMLERQFLQLEEYVIKGHLAGTSSLEGMRMPLQPRRIGGISEEEHAADRRGRQGRRATQQQRLRGSCGKLCNTCCATRHPFCLQHLLRHAPPLLSASRRKDKCPAATSGSAAGSKPVNRGAPEKERAVANTLGGNIINCWAKATGKPVRCATYCTRTV